MSFSNSACSRWILIALTGLALAIPSVSKADNFRVQQHRAKSAGEKSFSAAQSKYSLSRSKVKYHQAKYKTSRNPKRQGWASARTNDVFQSKIDMLKANVKVLQAEAQLAHLDGNTQLAKNKMQQANKTQTKLAKMEQSYSIYQARQANKQSGMKLRKVDKINPAYLPVVSNGLALVDPNVKTSTTQEPTHQAMGARAGRKAIKQLIKANNLLGAAEVQEQMMATPSRKGFKGWLDNRNKRKANKQLINTAYKVGKKAAKAGDLTHLHDAKVALSALTRMNGYKDPKTVDSLAKRATLMTWQTVRRIKDPAKIQQKMLKKVGLAAATGARKAAKRGDHQTMMILHQEAMKLPGVTGTRKYKKQLGKAAKQVLKGIKLAAKQGNLQAFETKLDWFGGYAEEMNFSDRKLARLSKSLSKLSLTAVKNSVVRDLDDAMRSLDPMSRNFNPTAARMLRDQAMQRHEQLTLDGHKVKTSMGRRSLASLIKKVDKALNKQEIAQINGQKEIKRPGFIRKGYERLFVSHHKRTEMPIANLQGAAENENLGFDVDQGGPGVQSPRPNNGQNGGANTQMGGMMNNMQNNMQNNMGAFGR